MDLSHLIVPFPGPKNSSDIHHFGRTANPIVPSYLLYRLHQSIIPQATYPWPLQTADVGRPASSVIITFSNASSVALVKTNDGMEELPFFKKKNPRTISPQEMTIALVYSYYSTYKNLIITKIIYNRNLQARFILLLTLFKLYPNNLHIK